MRLSAAMIENIRLRVSPEEKHALRAAAMRRGLTLSEYIREAASQACQRAAA
ncbi:plasmid mobilization protein [Mesorhizobium amorphae]|uniref:plasmid mobilization protein n=1 Tax=Mesorhizobium amorphae TaxID=71433 RepID=UPI001786447B